MNCRHCGTPLTHEFINLFNSPPSNAYLTAAQLNEPETFYPLRVYVCGECFLVQIDEYQKSTEIFNANYAYFSSFSASWLAHAQKYVDDITQRLLLNEKSFVIEIAANDGYLLQYFLPKKIPCLGIEPTASTAAAARQKGLVIREEFFSAATAKNLPPADLLLGNNVLAHVPDINDFVCGLKIALKPHGTITLEFPHLLNLIKFHQFDTIYHEHFSYLSLLTVRRIFAAAGLKIYDVDKLPTHGGSLRIYATHTTNVALNTTAKVEALIAQERAAALDDLRGYQGFEARANAVKLALWDFLLTAKKQGKKVIAYGAAAKGNTLLNYCGLRADLIDFIVDASPHKQNKFMPASHIPIVAADKIATTRPDYILILPWNLQAELLAQLEYVRAWDAKFVIPLPRLEIR